MPVKDCSHKETYLETKEKVLVHDHSLCTGCMRCMTTCSTYNNGSTSLARARLQIVRHEGHALTRIDEIDELVFQPMLCQQCDKPRCQEFCPVHAIDRDPKTRAMVINYDRCIGCRMCMAVCPFGAMRYDTSRRRVFKCQLCDGDPQCARLCPSGALQYILKDMANAPRISTLSKKLIEAQRVPVAEMVEVKK
jgi:Fe-S-cluster-containing dehydrogenase component